MYNYIWNSVLIRLDRIGPDAKIARVNFAAGRRKARKDPLRQRARTHDPRADARRGAEESFGRRPRPKQEDRCDLVRDKGYHSRKVMYNINEGPNSYSFT
jgi:hypothetical protein